MKKKQNTGEKKDKASTSKSPVTKTPKKSTKKVKGAASRPNLPTFLECYLDKESGEILGPEHPFDVEFVQGITQQRPDSLDCGLFVAVFAEYLSDGIEIPSDLFDSAFLRTRYATLIWKYGSEKVNEGYVSENDDPKKLKEQSGEAPAADDLVKID